MSTLPPHPTGYTIQRLLGQGNSARVYLALDEKSRKVALKLPFPETLADPARAERFANEVRLSLQLRHERVVVGYEGVGFGPKSFLSMRYFPESTLARWLELGRLSTPEAMQIIRDVARALVFLHGQGVVHQDVKSQNVYLESGRAALGDFGAAYFTAQGGKTAGSPFYMAPEIYRHEGSSFASDVYSLGVLAYEALANERPYVGRTYDELMAAHLSRFPRPLANLAPEAPRPVTQVVERALGKNATDRPSALEFARVFELALGITESQVTITPETAPAAPGRNLGRHGSATPHAAPPPDPRSADTAAKLAEPKRDEKSGKGSFWNPFKKRSSR